MAIIDRPKKSTRTPAAAPKSARVDHAFDTSLEDWLAQIAADQRHLAEIEAARITAELPPPTGPVRILTETEGEAPIIGDVCALDPDDIVLVNPAAHREFEPERVAEPQRSAEPEPATIPAPPRIRLGRGRRALNWGIAVAAVAVSATLVVVTAPTSSTTPPTAAPAGLAAAQGWVAGNVAPDDRVLIDDSHSTGLVGAGFAAPSVLPLSLLAADPDPNAWQSADFVVVTDALRADPSDEVVQALANSTTVASFGAVEVRQVLPAAATNTAALGAQLAANPALTLTPEAAATLTAGQVDQRIIILLGEALADHSLTVSDFPIEGSAPAGEPDGVRHRVLLTSYDGATLATDAAGVAAASAWLQNLTPPYTPLTVEAGPAGILATLSVGP
ncbi:hypothetical protein HQQ81_01395 [Microbacteriaceae bacterium VKM Ac-2854]|nr:hypothetical protein [Microbacteriaceae bacterium VKM Ac-2854]